MVFLVSLYKRTFASKKTKRFLYMNIAGVTRSLHRHLIRAGREKTNTSSLKTSGFRADHKFNTLDDAQLEVKDLHLSIGDKEILKGVDIHIPQNKHHWSFGLRQVHTSAHLQPPERRHRGPENQRKHHSWRQRHHSSPWKSTHRAPP